MVSTRSGITRMKLPSLGMTGYYGEISKNFVITRLRDVIRIIRCCSGIGGCYSYYAWTCRKPITPGISGCHSCYTNIGIIHCSSRISDVIPIILELRNIILITSRLVRNSLPSQDWGMVFVLYQMTPASDYVNNKRRPSHKWL